MDISPPSNSFKTRTSSTTTTTPVVPTNRLKKSKAANTGSSRPKAECIVKRQKNDEFHLVLESEKDDQQLVWSRKGSSQMGPTIDLVGSLQDECRRWFLNNVEKYLDGVETRVALMRSDSERAVTMYNIKKVSDWLDITCKEGSNLSGYCKESCSLNASEIEACQRMRNKIYSILMKHVERTAKGV